MTPEVRELLERARNFIESNAVFDSATKILADIDAALANVGADPDAWRTWLEDEKAWKYWDSEPIYAPGHKFIVQALGVLGEPAAPAEHGITYAVPKYLVDRIETWAATLAESGMEAKYADGTRTPNADLCDSIARDLRTIQARGHVAESGGAELADEEQVEAGAKVLADSPAIDAPKLSYLCWMGTAREVINATLRAASAPTGPVAWRRTVRDATDEYVIIYYDESIGKSPPVENIWEPLYARAEPQWKPTHRHAEGGLYQFLRYISLHIGKDTWTDGVLYCNEHGEQFARARVYWDDRFAALPGDLDAD